MALAQLGQSAPQLLHPALQGAVCHLLPFVSSSLSQLSFKRGHTNHPHAAAPAAEGENSGKLQKRLKEFIKLPWEVAMAPPEAAKTLGTFLGVPDLEPAAVLNLEFPQLHALLEATTLKGDKTVEKALFSHADAVTTRFFKDEVYYRGIVEFSNVCVNDCGYCGIRKHQPDIKRYTMAKDEVIEVARWAFTNKMGTLMIQGGELPTPQRLAYLTDVVRNVREVTIAMDLEQQGRDPKDIPADTSNLGLCVAMSVGELSRSDYQALWDAGARRYLLRIETSNPALYSMLHPALQTWQNRVDCLDNLRDIGFQIGTGVMVGLPGQTLVDLANDLLFFKSVGADMIGMGPYITEPHTPVAEAWQVLYGNKDKKAHMKDMFELTTRMNALARITLGNVNIAATTALQAIEPQGREVALRRGSNILMPILTPTKYREHYQLYEGKPCITDTADECRNCLTARIKMIGKHLQDGVWGDPLSYKGRIAGVSIPAAPTYPPPAGTRSMHTNTATFPRHPFTAQRPRGLHTSTRPIPGLGCASNPMGGSCQGGACMSCGGVRMVHPQPQATVAADVPSVVNLGAGTVAAAARPAGPTAGSDVPRVNIGVFGVMNAGKSTLINRIARQEVSIVDATPGTTADVKVVLMELHSAGPVKLFDTAGVDEQGGLGEKKRAKAMSALKESDVVVIVVDTARHSAAASPTDLASSLRWERELLDKARSYNSVPLLVLNTKGLAAGSAAASQQLATVYHALDASEQVPMLAVNLNDPAIDVPTVVSNFLQDGIARSKKRPSVKTLPEWALRDDALIFLNIPMDAETPTMRLLRPQALVQEEAIRFWATTVGYRMDLASARGPDRHAREAERRRFLNALKPVLAHNGPKLMVTDSQAMDIVHPWTLDPDTGKPLLPITTFSIAMIHRQSGGQLPLFAQGLTALRDLHAGDSVLVSEACNHNRITDTCNDIGMVQIPNKLEAMCGKGLNVEHAFGREFPDLDDGSLKRYKLALHCGGCMIDQQKMRARIRDLEEAGVPVTNYGLFLSYAHSPAALERALEPWGVHLPASTA